MTVIKKILALLLALLTMFSLSISIFAHEVADEESSEDNIFDWQDYEDELSKIEYQIRISSEMKDKVNDNIKLYLIADGVISAAALSTETLNEDIFLSFVEKNVDIEIINEKQRGSLCCDNMNKVWIQTVMIPTFNSNNWCIKHTLYEQRRCTSCDALWDSRSTQYAGCGRYKYTGQGYAVCPYAQYVW